MTEIIEASFEGLEGRHLLSAATVGSESASWAVPQNEIASPPVELLPNPLANDLAVVVDSAIPIGAKGLSISQLTAAAGVAITMVDQSRGAFWYTTTNGAVWQRMSSTISDASALLLFRDDVTRIAFTPSSQEPGRLSDLLVFREWDGRSAGNTGYNGGRVDVSDYPFQRATLIGEVRDISAIDLAVSSQERFVVSVGFGKLHISEAIGATSLTRIASLTLSNQELSTTNGVALSPDDKYAFVADGLLRIIDITARSSPREIATYRGANTANDVAVSPDGNRVYVASRGGGMHIVDVSNRSSPRLLGTFPRPLSGDVGHVTLSPDARTAYLSAGHKLILVDIGDPSSPLELSSVSLRSPGGVSLSADGRLVFVADYDQGIKIIDVSNPRSPVVLVAAGIGGVHEDVAVDADGRGVFSASYLNTRLFTSMYASSDHRQVHERESVGGAEWWVRSFAIKIGKVSGNIYLGANRGIDVIRVSAQDGSSVFGRESHRLAAEQLTPLALSPNSRVGHDSEGRLFAYGRPVVFGGPSGAEYVRHEMQGFTVLDAIEDLDQGNWLKVRRGDRDYRVSMDSLWQCTSMFHQLGNIETRYLDPTARTTFQVSENNGKFVIGGKANPTLEVEAGKTYFFDLELATFLFYLQTTGGGFDADAIYVDGFDGNGQRQGRWTWVVASDAPDEVFYQSENQPIAFGRIVVRSE